MSDRRCVLCDAVLRLDEGRFEVTPEANTLFREFSGHDADVNTVGGVCDGCESLPADEIRALAERAIQRLLRAMAEDWTVL